MSKCIIMSLSLRFLRKRSIVLIDIVLSSISNVYGLQERARYILFDNTTVCYVSNSSFRLSLRKLCSKKPALFNFIVKYRRRQ